MTHTKQKFKIGDLVQHHDKDLYSYCGIGIIIATEQSRHGPEYQVYWTKRGLDWDFEDYLERVI